MKIKDVCQQTGLTDRTVRYYIESGLLTPDCKENYAGRKNFSFTREDVERLEQIKVLRGAGFGVEQIKRLLAGRSTKEIVCERLQELESEHEKSEQLLETLQKADMDRDVSLEELTIILSSTPTASEEPEQDSKRPFAFSYWIFSVSIAVAWIVFWLLEDSRCGWMIYYQQEYWFYLAMLIGCIAWVHNDYWKYYATVIGVCLCVPFVSVVCGLIYGPAQMDMSHVAVIDSIPWNDKEYLLQCGFEEEESGILSYHDKTFEYWDFEKDEAVYTTLNIQVHNRKKDTERDLTYGDTALDELLSISYEDEISRWIRRPSYVGRMYYISSKSRFIIMYYDDNVHLDLTHLEELLYKLVPVA